MKFAPTAVYLSRQVGPTSTPAEIGAEELPDCRLPRAVRQNVKGLARQAAEALNPDALMFLAAAVEVEARRKSREERGA